MSIQIELESFRAEWLKSVREGNPSTSELGRRFAHKLLTHWLDIDEGSDDLVYCDGSGDGGIDIAYLHRGDSGEQDGAATGDTWYLVQSKYGSAFRGDVTLIEESRKVVDTLDGRTTRLSSLADGLLERLRYFRQAQKSDQDKIVLVFATDAPLTEAQKLTLGDVRAMGRHRLGANFDVEAISIATVYQRQIENAEASILLRSTVRLRSELVGSGSELLIGSTSLLNLYDFLKAYRAATDDLDQLYEKNVRRFLGGRGRVNKDILRTLREKPEKFGLYNNGITIIVSDIKADNNAFDLVAPFVVNGCQTTRAIWEVCHQKMEAGGTGIDPELEDWKKRASTGVVVTKIVKIGKDGEPLQKAITRYTNSQNAVREKDFLAITDDFKVWKEAMADKYDVFLEIQRGGWESQSAWQKQNPSRKQFKEHANAFDLLKVYGAGWLGEAGIAYGRNAAFLPSGSIFKRIMGDSPTGDLFGVDDLYAAFLLMQHAGRYEFGRTARQATRRLTKFLYYLVTIRILKYLLICANNVQPSHKDITHAFLNLSKNSGALTSLLDTGIAIVDEYLRPGVECCVFNEPSYNNVFSSDLNAYMKSERLGKAENGVSDVSPLLQTLINDNCRILGRATPGSLAPLDVITMALKAV